MNKKKDRYLLYGLIILSVILCFWGIRFGLPQLLHDDEQALVKRALKFGSGDLNPHFFFYPSLQMYILFIAYGIYFVFGIILGLFSSVKEFAYSYIRDPSCIYIIGRSISASFGVMTVWMTYFLGKKIYGKNTGLLAGLFLLSIPKFVEIAHYIKSDTAMLFMLTVFFYICLQIYHTGKRKFYIFAGLSLGLATASKYNALALAPIMLLAHLFHNSGKVKIVPLLFSVNLFLGGLFLFFGFTIGCPFWLLDFTTFSRQFVQLITFTASDTQFGQLGAPLNYLKVILFLGEKRIFLGIICMLGLILALFRKTKENLMIVISVLIIYLMCARQRIQQWQYLLPAFPFLVLLGAKFVRDLYYSIQSKYLKYIFGLIISLIVLDPLIQSAIADYWISQKDTRVLAKEWVEANIPENSKILLDIRGPQLLRSKELIQQQYELAEKLNHPKKDYFKLQLEVQNGKEYQYYHIERTIVAPSEMKEYSQQVELNERIDVGIETLKKKGFKYIIIAPSETVTEEERILNSTCIFLKEFRPKKYVPPLLFRVRIYKINKV